MTTWTLIRQNLRYYWRTNMGVLLGAAISTAILVGALVVGDSVRFSLRQIGLSRIGQIHWAISTTNRYFRSALADDLETELKIFTVPALQLRGLMVNSENRKRANRIQILGVNKHFWKLAPAPTKLKLNPEEIIINTPLADRLGLKIGDEVLIRVNKPDLLPRDAPLSDDTDYSAAMRLRVKNIITDQNFGRFNLKANQIAPLNAFVSLSLLQKKIDLPKKANILLLGDDIDPHQVSTSLKKVWQLADANLELRKLPRKKCYELRSDRIFLEQAVVQAARQAALNPTEIFTYFVNEIRHNQNSTPYSLISSLSIPSGTKGIIPSQLTDKEIIVNQWLADDLQVNPGDTVTIKYFVMETGHTLSEQSRQFRVHSIIPLNDSTIDRDLMPSFPGLAGAQNCSDWKPGIPVNLKKIRDKDEQYWESYGGTPKAFINLAAGREMWSNQFGDLTAIRFPMKHNSHSALDNSILTHLDPAGMGMFFQPVRERALTAGKQALDFGQLFLGLSFFLIIAAILLTALLFVFGIEQRNEQTGTLLALGIDKKKVRLYLLGEGTVLALAGSLIGTAAGLLYTRLMMAGLATVWLDAVGTSDLTFHATLTTLITGGLIGFITALSAIWLTVRKQAVLPIHNLLNAGLGLSLYPSQSTSLRQKKGLWTAGVIILATVLLLFYGNSDTGSQTAGMFFLAGSLLLISALLIIRFLLQYLAAHTANSPVSLVGLSLRNCTRRQGRSLAVAILLACGCFLVVSVAANRRNPLANLRERSSGTGGFALYAESTMPIYRDLNTEDGRAAYGLVNRDMNTVSILQLRVHDGDDASCLNLNRPQRPRLLGVPSQKLHSMQAFSFVGNNRPNDWLALRQDIAPDIVPAIADLSVIKWVLNKSPGDELEFRDEQGRNFRLRLVSALDNSIFQGSLLIDEKVFQKRFPSEDGYRVFLIDTPEQNTEKVSEILSENLTDIAWQATPAPQRLAQFYRVENTYLSIFQLLGGLGLILGSMGLGLVVTRNVLERRGELGMLQALGFDRYLLKRMILYEHSFVWILGLIGGVVSAIIAVLPAFLSPGVMVPYVSLTITLAVITISGIVWAWLATVLALRGPLLDAVRNE